MPYPPLQVLYEDNHLLAVVKPAGLATMGVSSEAPSLFTLAKDYIKLRYQKPGNVYLGVVSRLDRLVTGVTLFARDVESRSATDGAVSYPSGRKNILGFGRRGGCAVGRGVTQPSFPRRRGASDAVGRADASGGKRSPIAVPTASKSGRRQRGRGGIAHRSEASDPVAVVGSRASDMGRQKIWERAFLSPTVLPCTPDFYGFRIRLKKRRFVWSRRCPPRGRKSCVKGRNAQKRRYGVKKGGRQAVRLVFFSLSG